MADQQEFLALNAIQFLESIIQSTRAMSFLNFPKHCNNGGDLSIPLVAYIHMADYPDDDPLPTEDVPLFVSTRFPQERRRLFSLPEVGNAFMEPTEPIRGLTLTSLIESLGSVTVLDLVKGENCCRLNHCHN